MKRKRGPAPHAKKSRVKQTDTIVPNNFRDSGEEGNDFDDEEDSFKGISGDEDQGQTPDSVASKEPVNNANGTTEKDKSRGGKMAAPAKGELMDLLFQSRSFQSNLFKLQVDQLLSEVRVKYDKMDKVERILHQIKDILASLTESPEQLVPAYPPTK
jgi:U3 small nucleolar RNA-associated protein 22